MPDLFKEILPSIMETKKSVFQDEDDFKDYNAFMVNRALSLQPDCLFIAVDMSRLSHLPKNMQYDYYMEKVRGRKRQFIPWPKKAGTPELKAVMWYFGYSEAKASVALTIISEEDVTRICALHKDANS